MLPSSGANSSSFRLSPLRAGLLFLVALCSAKKQVDMYHYDVSGSIAIVDMDWKEDPLCWGSSNVYIDGFEDVTAFRARKQDVVDSSTFEAAYFFLSHYWECKADETFKFTIIEEPGPLENSETGPFMVDIDVDDALKVGSVLKTTSAVFKTQSCNIYRDANFGPDDLWNCTSAIETTQTITIEATLTAQGPVTSETTTEKYSDPNGNIHSHYSGKSRASPVVALKVTLQDGSVFLTTNGDTTTRTASKVMKARSGEVWLSVH